MNINSWKIIGSLMLAEIALSYDLMIVYSAIPKFNMLFGDPVKVGWVVTGFMLVSAASAAVGGKLGDLYGRKKILLWSLLCAIAGAVICALSTGLEGVIWGRALQGVTACFFPLCVGLVRQHLPKDSVALGVGIVLGAAAFGTGVGSIVSGYIIDHFAWPTMFWLTAVLSAIGMLSIWVCVPAGEQTRSERFDWLGGVLFVPGLAMLLYALQVLQQTGWVAPSGWGLVVGGAAILLGWYQYELRHPHPLIDVRQVFSGPMAKANLIMVLSAMTVFQCTLISTIILQQPVETGAGFGLSATMYGIVKLPGAWLGVVLAPLAGHWVARRGARAVLLCSVVCLIVVGLSLSLLRGSLYPVVAGIWALMLLAVVIFTSIPNLIIENMPAERTGELIGFSTVVRNVSSGIGTQFVLLILASSSTTLPGGHKAYPSDTAYLTLFLTLTAVWVLLLWVVRSAPAKPLASAA